MELDLILQTFEQAFTQNIGAVMGLVQNTMYILLTIDFVLSVLIALLGNGNMLQLLIEKILKYGFWVWFFRMSPTIINNIADSMALIGAAIGGDASIIQSPSAIMERCHSLIQPIWAYATENSLSIMDLNIGQFLTLCFVIVFIFICYLIITVQTCVTYLEFYVVSVLAIVLIPFGVNKYTSFLSEKGIGAIPAAGIKIAAMQAVLGVTTQVLNNITIQVETSDLYSFTGVMATCGICAFVCWQIPSMVSGLLAGSPSLTASTAASNAAAFSSGAVTGAKIAGSTAVSGAKGAVGAARAASLIKNKFIDKIR